MLRPGCGCFEPQKFHAAIALFDVGGNLRNQRNAVAVRDHLHHRREAARTERHAAAVCHAVCASARHGRTECERLIAQAMAVLQQDKTALIDVVGDDTLVLQIAASSSGTASRNSSSNRCMVAKIGLVNRQSQHRHIERAAFDFIEQLPCLGFAQLQPQFRETLLAAAGRIFGKRIGSQRGNKHRA